MGEGVSEPGDFVEYRLLRLADRLRRRFEAAMRAHGLTARQFSVLAVLAARPGVTAAELARAVLSTPQSMGALVDQLEARGLVVPRERRGRGVAAPAALTDAGMLALASASETARRLEESTREALGPELEPLVSALSVLDGHLRARPSAEVGPA